ncbi:Agamous-like MADS-box protein AGL82 [Linum perenne]
MGHKRVKMELIKNDRSRTQTYKKRKASLFKKIKEFTILCDVKACLIIFGPGGELETWSPESSTLPELIQQYRTSDQPRRSYSVSDYFTEKKKRVEVELANERKKIYKRKFSNEDDGRRWVEGLSEDQLKMVLRSLDSKLKAADERIAALNAEWNNLGLVVHRGWQQLQQQNGGEIQIQDVGFGIETEIGKGHPPNLGDCSDPRSSCQFEGRNSVNDLWDMNSFSSVNFYQNNSLLVPGEGGGGGSYFGGGSEIPYWFQQGELSPLMADEGISWKQLHHHHHPVVMQQQQQEMGRNGILDGGNEGMMNSLPGIGGSNPWISDLDGGMSFVSSSSYQQILQFSPMAGGFASTRMFPREPIGGGGLSFDFDAGKDHKL